MNICHGYMKIRQCTAPKTPTGEAYRLNKTHSELKPSGWVLLSFRQPEAENAERAALGHWSQ